MGDFKPFFLQTEPDFHYFLVVTAAINPQLIGFHVASSRHANSSIKGRRHAINGQILPTQVATMEIRDGRTEEQRDERRRPCKEPLTGAQLSGRSRSFWCSRLLCFLLGVLGLGFGLLILWDFGFKLFLAQIFVTGHWISDFGFFICVFFYFCFIFGFLISIFLF
ncbi:hypothetical protein V6Z11_A09G135300 [Gossypium hirsutum]